MNFAQFFRSNRYYKPERPAYFLKVKEDGTGKPILVTENQEEGALSATGLSHAIRDFVKEQRSSADVCFMRIDIVLGRKVLLIYPRGYDMRIYCEYLQRVSLTYLLSSMSRHNVMRDLAQSEGDFCWGMLQQAELLFGDQTSTKTIGWVNLEERVTCICLGYDLATQMILACFPKKVSPSFHNPQDESRVRDFLRVSALKNGIMIPQAMSRLK